MNLPQCPNSLEAKCERSELRLLGENEQSFMFVCHTCKLLWAVSKEKNKQSARWHNRARKIEELTERERQRERLPKVHYNPGVPVL